MRKIYYTPEERQIADSFIRAQMKRQSEDEYVREKGREEGREEELIKVVVEKIENDSGKSIPLGSPLFANTRISTITY